MKCRNLLTIILFLSFSLVYSQKEITKWTRVDSLMRIGLVKTAEADINDLFNEAKLNDNLGDYIKALNYKVQLLKSHKDYDINLVVGLVDNEIEVAQSPRWQLLHSIRAEVLQKYFSENHWKISKRTKLNTASTDINTWTTLNFEKEILRSASVAVRNTENVRNIKIEVLDEVLKGDSTTRKYRPGLFDLLAYRAIKSTSQYYFTKDFISNNNTAYFLPADKFLKLRIDTLKYVHPLYKNLIIFQKLLKNHRHNPTAFIGADLERLKYVRKYFLNEEKYELPYLNALNSMITVFPRHESSAEVQYEKALVYTQRGRRYDPFSVNSEEYKLENTKAMEVCKKTIYRFPNSLGAKYCSEIKKALEAPSVSVSINGVEVPQSPILATLKYKNLEELYFRIVKLNYENEQNKLSNQQLANRLDFYLQQKASEEWIQHLPKDHDYNLHSVKLLFPELDKGYYVLLASTSPEFEKKKLIYSNFFWVSHISFISRNDGKKGMDVYVQNRKSGEPMSNVKLEVFYKTYNYRERGFTLEKKEELFSDHNGYLHIQNERSKNNYLFKFSYQSDSLSVSDLNPLYIRENQRPQLKAHFFLDRKIYRPGQTIYYKGIIVENHNNENKILKNYKTTVSLIDVNNQTVSKTSQTTNDYGSINGSFILPLNLLNGQMRLKTPHGSIAFQVEEYKRPNFEIQFDDPKEQFRINDTVIVRGAVKSFSGSELSNALVKYSVRSKLFPWLKGETKTSDKGRFEIRFLASENPSHPILNFTNYYVSVDVTDINGETQSAGKSIIVPEVDLKLDCSVPKHVDKHTEEEFLVKATNYSDQKQNVNVSIGIYKLKDIDRPLKSKKKNRPDQFVMDKETFYSHFPYEQYDHEKDYKKWEIANQVFQAEINTGEVNGFSIPRLSRWEDGMYKMILKSYDQFDEKLELEKYFTLYDPKSDKVPLPVLNWFVPAKSNANVGDNCSFIIGSSAPNVSVLYEFHNKGKLIKSERIKISSEQKEINFPISQEIEGKLELTTNFVFENEVFRNSQSINVKDKNKELKILLETFRSKLKPGAQEEWKIKLISSDENIEAELLACMYDASLDKIRPNTWGLYLQKRRYPSLYWNSYNNFNMSSQGRNLNYRRYSMYFSEIKKSFEFLPLFYSFNTRQYLDVGSSPLKIRGMSNVKRIAGDELMDLQEIAGVPDTKMVPSIIPPMVELRKNFNETVFFYPTLYKNENGEYIISFKAPDALSKWKFMALLHTKDLRSDTVEKEVITQKELMVIPNIPRFFRQGDTLNFSAKLTNLNKNILKGKVELRLFNAVNNFELKKMNTGFPNVQSFIIEPSSSQSVQWKLIIPENVDAIKYKIHAVSDKHNDGEERIIPVLSKKKLVTKSLPLHLNPNQAKDFNFSSLLNSKKNRDIQHHQLKLEITANPNWYVIQALAAIDKIKGENSISLFNSFYANVMANHILQQNPKIKAVFEIWKKSSPDSFLSKLELNQDLKSALLEETPWVTEAQNDSERMHKLALYFNQNNLQQKLRDDLQKLLKLQLNDGSWAWFKGGRSNRYITQSILIGFVRLYKNNLLGNEYKTEVHVSIMKAFEYLNKKVKDNYQKLIDDEEDLKKDHLSNLQIQYLYALSYWLNNVKNDEDTEVAISFYLNQAQQFWMNKNNYLQAMIALILNRNGETQTAQTIIKSLSERAVTDEEMGVYWNQLTGYYWYQSTVETQSMMLEAFTELKASKKEITGLKKYLLKQKQTQMWNTQKASVEAVYALMLGDDQFLDDTELPYVRLGSSRVVFDKAEAGTSYAAKTWKGSIVDADMGKIHVKNPNSKMVWGAVHWQYFEDLDKISSYKSPISIEKNFYKKELTNAGPQLIPLDNSSNIHIGDKVVSRIIVKVDRDMEFIHLKDMRASAFEPLSIVSKYKYNGAVGYYESTKDAATHFYFDSLRKGTYVFEYEVVASQSGDFSNGISTIQCMYAPEFNSHSEGIRVKVQSLD